MSDAISTTLKSSATQILGSLAHCMRKAEDHAKASGTDETNFLEARLYPDMFEMKRQVYIATDIVRRGAHRLTGTEPQPVEDDEQTFAALAARCETALTVPANLHVAEYDVSRLHGVRPATQPRRSAWENGLSRRGQYAGLVFLNRR